MDKNENNGNLYSKVKMSIRTADIIILASIAALVICLLIAIK